MATKKSFISEDNPALRFLSSAGENSQAEEAPAKKPAAKAKTPRRTPAAPEGYKINPQYIEKKTRRVQLIMRPSLYKAIQKAAKKAGLSVNDYIHSALEEATTAEKGAK